VTDSSVSRPFMYVCLNDGFLHSERHRNIEITLI